MLFFKSNLKTEFSSCPNCLPSAGQWELDLGQTTGAPGHRMGGRDVRPVVL